MQPGRPYAWRLPIIFSIGQSSISLPQMPIMAYHLILSTEMDLLVIEMVLGTAAVIGGIPSLLVS